MSLQRFPSALYVVREPNTGYCDNRSACTDTDTDTDTQGDLLARIAALLQRPSWPEFTDGAYLNARQAVRLYRAAHGVKALAHILDRSVHLRGLARDYCGEPGGALSELEESRIWNALKALSDQLVDLADDLPV